MHNLILSLKSITKEYLSGTSEVQNVLDGVNLDVKKGEIVAILGPSGSGKSTLLQIIGLLLNATSGHILLNGENCINITEKKRTLLRRRYLGFIYQFHHLLPEFSVIENLVLPQMINGKTKKEAILNAMAKLEVLDMLQYAEKDVTKLSGGEQQRVAVARSIVNDPHLILADEPTGNLDQQNTKLVLQLIKKQIKNHNKAAVIVTHNTEILCEMDRSFKLVGGLLNPV